MNNTDRPEYTTIVDVLKEAGFYHIQQNEHLSGAADGANNKFITAYKPLYNSDAVVVTVNDAVVDVVDIDETKGIITLSASPASESTVLAEYYYSAVDPDFTRKCITSAQSYIDRFMRGYDPCCPYGIKGRCIPSVIEQICRLYAAGLLLIRDYGYNVDTELTSKDGYKKIELAKEILAEFRSSGGLCGDSDSSEGINGAIGSSSAASAGDLICNDIHDCGPCSDACFIRGFHG